MGAFVGANTPAGIDYRKRMLKESMVAHLKALDAIDKMVDTATECDVKQLRYKFIQSCANTMPIYWRRAMPPHITKPIMASVVDPRLRESMASLAHAHESPPALSDRWWQEAQLPTCMGGEGVGGHEGLCEPSYDASLCMLATASRDMLHPHQLAPRCGDGGSCGSRQQRHRLARWQW